MIRIFGLCVLTQAELQRRERTAYINGKTAGFALGREDALRPEGETLIDQIAKRMDEAGLRH